MKNWNDILIKKHIEELIEESYILSLSPEDLKMYLRDFVCASETVLRREFHAPNSIKVTKIKIALLRAHLLENEIGSVYDQKTPHVRKHEHKGNIWHEKVLRAKRIITTLMADIDSHLSELVAREIKKCSEAKTERSRRKSSWVKTAMEMGYYGLLFFTMSLLWVVIFY